MHPHVIALTIMRDIGKAVVLSDGRAGTVDRVFLDELHGLRISIKGHDGEWPISKVKLSSGP